MALINCIRLPGNFWAPGRAIRSIPHAGRLCVRRRYGVFLHQPPPANGHISRRHGEMPLLSLAQVQQDNEYESSIE
jgi:hypothetical protein